MRRRHRVRSILIFMLLCISAGFLTAYKFMIPDKGNIVKILPKDTVFPKKIITDEALIKSIQQKQDLITMEVELSTNLTVDESWGTLDILKKYQNIHFVGKGLYAIELSKLKKEDIKIDNEKQSITILSPKPYVKAIYIDDKNTIFESTQNGTLRFGEIKLSSDQFNLLLTTAKNSMNEKIQSKETLNQALDKSRTAIVNLVNSIIGETEKNQFTVSVQFQ